MLWKLYLGLVCLLVMASVSTLLIEGPHPIYAIADYIIMSLTIAQIVGLYGYAFRRPMLSERFWQLAFPVFVLNLLASLLVGGVRYAATQSDIGVPAATIVISLFALPLFLPLLLADRRYAFRSPTIWK